MQRVVIALWEGGGGGHEMLKQYTTCPGHRAEIPSCSGPRTAFLAIVITVLSTRPTH